MTEETLAKIRELYREYTDPREGGDQVNLQGIVFDTNPKPGTSVASGSSVTLLVSSGAPQVPVPDVRGKNSTEAQNILTQAGLQSSVSPQSSDTVPSGTVKITPDRPAASSVIGT